MKPTPSERGIVSSRIAPDGRAEQLLDRAVAEVVAAGSRRRRFEVHVGQRDPVLEAVLAHREAAVPDRALVHRRAHRRAPEALGHAHRARDAVLVEAPAPVRAA